MATIVEMESPQQRTARIRREYVEQLGDETAIELAGFLKRICHQYCYGIYDSNVGTGRFRHSRAKLESEDSHPRKLGPTDIYRHITTHNKGEYIWYTNALPRVRIGQRPGRIAIYCLDIDYKHSGRSDAYEMLCHLQSVINEINGCYAESSTNGGGIHLYVPVLHPRNASDAQISDWCHRWQRRIAEISAQGQRDYGIVASCTEVRGMPPVRANRQYVTMGTLAKLPRLSGPESAEILLDGLRCAIDASVLCPLISGEYFCAETETAIHPPFLGIGDCGEGTSRIVERVPSSGDAMERMRGVATSLAKRLNRVPSEAEILNAYESSGAANQSVRHRARENRARKVHDYLSKHFVPLSSACHPLAYLDEIKGLVTPQLISSEYKAKDATLKHEDIALVLYLIRQSTGQTLAKKWFLTASRNLKREGKTSRTLDNKRFAASIRILQRLGLIQYSSGYQPGVRSRRYLAVAGVNWQSISSKLDEK